MTLILKEANGRERDVDVITSDTHFMHKNIAVLADRPFDNSESTDDMDETLISNWNEVVGPDDTVLHCGDIVMGPRAVSLQLLGRLNGHIILIPGNHDYVSSVFKETMREKNWDRYAEFTEIIAEVGNTLVTSNGNTADVSHYPFEDMEHRDRDDVLPYPVDHGQLVVHGHTHQPNVVSENNRMFHVGVDSHNMAPVRAGVVEEWIDSHH